MFLWVPVGRIAPRFKNPQWCRRRARLRDGEHYARVHGPWGRLAGAPVRCDADAVGGPHRCSITSPYPGSPRSIPAGTGKYSPFAPISCPAGIGTPSSSILNTPAGNRSDSRSRSMVPGTKG